jgi:hypothetical protein
MAARKKSLFDKFLGRLGLIRKSRVKSRPAHIPDMIEPWDSGELLKRWHGRSRDAYDFLVEHPGAHVKELQTKLKVSKPLSATIVGTLSEQGVIVPRVENGYKRLYPALKKPKTKKKEVVTELFVET